MQYFQNNVNTEYLLEVCVQVKVEREGNGKEITSHLVGLISARLTKANYSSGIKSESVRAMSLNRHVKI